MEKKMPFDSVSMHVLLEKNYFLYVDFFCLCSQAILLL